MKSKLTSLEKQWILYDVGNSAFVLLVSTILPIYFNYLADSAKLASSDYLAYWGYAISISTLIVAALGPVLGSIADNKNFKKKLFCASLIIGVIACLCLGVSSSWLVFLIVFVIAKTAYSVSLIFYDSMLTDITTEERMDTVSSNGYAWGYIGSCIPFIISLLIVLNADKFGMPMATAMMIAFAITAAWWLVTSLPLLKNYKQLYYVEHGSHVVSTSFSRLLKTIKEIAKQKKILFFLLAFFFYIDGVYTIIDMATAYGQSLGLDSTGLLLALLLTQVVAFPCALIFGRFSKKFNSATLIRICIAAYCGIAIYAIWLDSQLDFWMLAVLVGMFQGAIQALSRSYFAKIIPADKSGEYFGIMDICGKGAAFFGTFLVSFISQMTGSTSAGVGSLAIMFFIGFVLFCKAEKV
ncbi:MFS transporter [Faecalicatena contorta]|uniref:MFS transporter n=1 Tax=Faecalicatena contorta TaxID=39482 RepID=UPI001F3CA381|nr:MFS transporter [Faecalicatena contorta]MCF2555905.1 MFS transporter [Faecalicatena contorta]MCF2681286.1 MFS transporter [Faecalicatena contorta]